MKKLLSKILIGLMSSSLVVMGSQMIASAAAPSCSGSWVQANQVTVSKSVPSPVNQANFTITTYTCAADGTTYFNSTTSVTGSAVTRINAVVRVWVNNVIQGKWDTCNGNATSASVDSPAFTYGTLNPQADSGIYDRALPGGNSIGSCGYTGNLWAAESFVNSTAFYPGYMWYEGYVANRNNVYIAGGGPFILPPAPSTTTIPPVAVITGGSTNYPKGHILQTPQLQMIYWDQAGAGYKSWQTSWTDSAGYTSYTAEDYLNSEFAINTGIGNTKYGRVLEQYCDGTQLSSWYTGGPYAYPQPGSPLCDANQRDVQASYGNPLLQNTDITYDFTKSRTDNNAEAINAIKNNPNGGGWVVLPNGQLQTYYIMVLLKPSNPTHPDCSFYHGTAVTTITYQGNNYSNVEVPWIYMPYAPDCFNSPLAGNTRDAFGHGYFDWYSFLMTHEVAESTTDPGTNGGVSGGYFLGGGQEIGDLCETSTYFPGGGVYDVYGNDGTQYYAVQALWSNSEGKCSIGGVY